MQPKAQSAQNTQIAGIRNTICHLLFFAEACWVKEGGGGCSICKK